VYDLSDILLESSSMYVWHVWVRGPAVSVFEVAGIPIWDDLPLKINIQVIQRHSSDVCVD
jgi:hypothetical protein